MDICIMYMSDGKEIEIKGLNLYWIEENNKYKFYAEENDGTGEYLVAEISSFRCDAIIRVENNEDVEKSETTVDMNFANMLAILMKEGDWDKITKAFQLRDNGKSLDEIAKELGYKEDNNV